jgi:membrane associated rhomboid family serine protease
MNNNVVDFKNPKKGKDEKPKHPPLINLPPITKALLLITVAVYAVTFLLLDEAARASLFLNFGFVPAIWTGESSYSIDMNTLISPLTYMFLHGNMMHIVMNGTMLMAFGAGIEKWMGAKKFLWFFILCGIASVIVETLIHPFSQHPVVGASGAESGLFAAILIMLQSQGRLPTAKYGIWPFAAFWIGLSLVFGLIGGSVAGSQIAWAAHLGGFIAGFGLLKLKYFKAPV